MNNYKLADPHHWTDVKGGRAWSKEVRGLFEKLGFKVYHSEYGESFFYIRNGELRGCDWHRFMNCGGEEITLDQLKKLVENREVVWCDESE